jgi:uncharacterized protein YukE
VNNVFSNESGCWKNAMKTLNNAKKTLKNIGKPLDNIKKVFRELGAIQKNWAT